jgi:hypothetical protein rflaF_08677
MQGRLSKGLLCGLIGNALFILFALVTFIFYTIFFTAPDALVKSLEILAYAVEICGFAVLAVSDFLICTAVRMRKWFKISFSAYILMEAALMILELNSYNFSSFYHPYSFALAIVHSILSAAVCFTFISLDPYKTKLEVIVIICIGVILGGMFGNLLGMRIYFSILVNAVSFTILFAAVIYLKKREIIEIDCHGDKARVAEYKSLFED